MTPYSIIYRKVCHLLVKLKHKMFWALKQCNFNRTYLSFNLHATANKTFKRKEEGKNKMEETLLSLFFSSIGQSIVFKGGGNSFLF